MANLLFATRESDSLRSENPTMSQPSRGLVLQRSPYRSPCLKTIHAPSAQEHAVQEIGVQLASVASWLRFGQPVRVSVWCFRVRGAPSAGPVRRGLCCDQQGLTHAAAQSQELLRSW